MRTTLLIGGGAVLLTLLFAVPLGLAAGYFGGRTDALISRLFDLIWSFPALLLGALLSTAISLNGADIGPITIASGSKLIPLFVIGLVYVPYMTRPLRGQVMALRGRPFIEAARADGMRPVTVMVSELLPHLWTTMLVLSTLLFVNAVVLEAALSFLGAGVGPPEPSLGSADRRRAGRRRAVAAPAARAQHRPGCDRPVAQRSRRGAPARARPARRPRPRPGARAMIRFAARRFAAALITAWVASIIAFVLFWTVPNVDPSYFLGGAEHGTNESRARATEKYGLDDPLPVQYVRLMKSILNGDIECFYTCGSLREVFFEALPVTISLVAGAALIAVGLGVWLALIAVRHRGRWQDRLITTARRATGPSTRPWRPL